MRKKVAYKFNHYSVNNKIVYLMSDKCINGRLKLFVIDDGAFNTTVS
jgi:hypothetical protein